MARSKNSQLAGALDYRAAVAIIVGTNQAGRYPRSLGGSSGIPLREGWAEAISAFGLGDRC